MCAMNNSELSEENKVVAEIARRHLRVPTLQTRQSDSLDFYDLAVWELREALEAAYRAGLEASTKAWRQQQRRR